jgi:cell volume regulation protein A
VYFLAPPERAQALDRFFVDVPTSMLPDRKLLGDFYLPGAATLGALADIYGLPVEDEMRTTTLAEYFVERLGRPPEPGDSLQLGDVVLQAHKVSGGLLETVGLQLSEAEAPRITAYLARIRDALMFWQR